MQLYMTGGLKSICKFKEKQVADTLVKKRASATANINTLQIHQLPKEYLHKRINRRYRYIRYQKSKSAHRFTYFNHGTPQRKILCNPANWSRACPTKRAGVHSLFLAWKRELNSNQDCTNKISSFFSHPSASNVTLISPASFPPLTTAITYPSYVIQVVSS
mgnify:CR=1 FL=1